MNSVFHAIRYPTDAKYDFSGSMLCTAHELTWCGFSTVIAVRGDITSQEDLKAMASQIRSDVGYINILIANAGMTGPMLEDLKPRHTLTDFVEHAWKTPMNEFTNVYGLNCTALYYTVLAFLELLDEGNSSRYQGGKSQVIATASTASFLRQPRAGYAYLSSKAAVISLIKSFSTFCVPWGIRFNAIAAGCSFLPHHSHLSATLIIPPECSNINYCIVAD